MLLACVLFLVSVTHGERWYVLREAGIQASKHYTGSDSKGYTDQVYSNVDLATCKAACMSREKCNAVNYGTKGNCCKGKCGLIVWNDILFSSDNPWNQYLPKSFNSDSYYDAYIVLKDFVQVKATPGPDKAMADLWEDKLKMERGEAIRDYQEVSTNFPKIQYVIAVVVFMAVIGLVFQYKKNSLMQVEDDNQYTVVEA